MLHPLESLVTPLMHPITQGNPGALANAVNTAAFDLACRGMAFTDAHGVPRRGLSDERAVMLVLDAYAKDMHRQGHVNIALEAQRTKNLIGALKPPKLAMPVKPRKQK